MWENFRLLLVAFALWFLKGRLGATHSVAVLQTPDGTKKLVGGVDEFQITVEEPAALAGTYVVTIDQIVRGDPVVLVEPDPPQHDGLVIEFIT